MLLALTLLVAGCGKGDPQKCEAACRNYANLMYWAKKDPEIARLPPAQRDDARKQALVELTTKMEKGLDFCVSKCQAANNDEQMKCMTDAKTAPDVKACAVDDE